MSTELRDYFIGLQRHLIGVEVCWETDICVKCISLCVLISEFLHGFILR